MKTAPKNILIIVLLFLCSKLSIGQDLFIPYDSKEKLESDVNIIIKDFDTFIKKKGIKPSYLPGAKIKTAPFLIKWDESNKGIILPYWDDLMDEQKELFKTWRGEEAEEFFISMFNWFFIPHELGHFIESSFNTDTLTPYEGEVAANEFAIAFLTSKEVNKAKIEYIEESLQAVLKILPDIDLGNMSEEEYFNTNYHQLGDPNVYGYFQFKMILNILNYRDQIDLKKYCE